jgi:hypothetical protein
MNFPQGLSKKEVLKVIHHEVDTLPPVEYKYNVYSWIKGLGKIKTGVETADINHYRRAKRRYLRSLKQTPPKFKASKRQERLSQLKLEKENGESK